MRNSGQFLKRFCPLVVKIHETVHCWYLVDMPASAIIDLLQQEIICEIVIRKIAIQVIITENADYASLNAAHN